MTLRILLLGGTAEARDIAATLADDPRYEVMSSLAGAVSNPKLPVGAVRIGGFGGVSGLAEHLQHHHIDALIDATHPFAQNISHNAQVACQALGIPRVRLQRPGYREQDGDQWHRVDTLAEAASMLDAIGAPALVTTGRQGLAAYCDVAVHCTIRCVDPPQGPLPKHHEIVLARGPFTYHEELTLLQQRSIATVTTKDSGGLATVEKLHAARALGIPVIMVSRPAAPTGPVVSHAVDVQRWLDQLG